MKALLLADTMPLESAVPMPFSIRPALYLLLTSALALSLYSCLQGILMIHDYFQILQWIGEVTER